ncbi:ferrous iron transport protein A [Clostridium botulinum C]|uniref:Ferrous iron transport protein A n=5 Tax=Clostridium TaxID=1485 RepID=A0A9Q4TGD7_CLOBO|nr:MULTISPECIES: FeoA family protein [Clostridium]EGO87180.1 iron transporter FeoA [Clostridium botulinum C str. Stockholm]AYF54560.1 ferrous iron transport protein A [Clostridium novyi]EES91185.1 conserved domain protein [Clostridium botulinum D str. 1873]KEI10811.1 iron transporter FeoA [Clostridium sp. K25]KEI13310.1 iron transporter FeoA [Clostridium novyi B str. NCTC 9691]
MENTLKNIPVGSKAKVVGILRNSQFKRRLMDMGIIPGVEIIVTGKAPLGDPIEILVRGYKLTLRGKEAVDIMVG